MLDKLFEAIDSKDTTQFVSLLSEGCAFRFGNLPEVVGRKDIETFVSGFFASIESLSHDVTESWDISGGVICRGDVRYVRKNGTHLTIPFCNIFKVGDAGIIEYLIYADTSQLYG